MFGLRIKLLLASEHNFGAFQYDDEFPSHCFQYINKFNAELKEKGKGVVFYSPNIVTGLLGAPSDFDFAEFETFISEGQDPEKVKIERKTEVSFKDKSVKKSKPVKTKDILQFKVTGVDLKLEKMNEHFTGKNFVFLD